MIKDDNASGKGEINCFFVAPYEATCNFAQLKCKSEFQLTIFKQTH
jgi:hypothetical protein